MTDVAAVLDGFVIEGWYDYPPALSVQCTRCRTRTAPEDLPALTDGCSDADAAVSLSVAVGWAVTHSTVCTDRKEET